MILEKSKPMQPESRGKQQTMLLSIVKIKGFKILFSQIHFKGRLPGKGYLLKYK